MNKINTIPRGIFKAHVKGIHKKQERYCVFLLLADLNKSITIDIHDSISETLGTSHFDKSLIKKIIIRFPNIINVSNLNGYWKIENEYKILSDVISTII